MQTQRTNKTSLQNSILQAKKYTISRAQRRPTLVYLYKFAYILDYILI